MTLPRTITPAQAAPLARRTSGSALTSSLREEALQLLLISAPQAKAAAISALNTWEFQVDTRSCLTEPQGVPGRPERPLLVQPSALKNRAVGTPEGHASLIHALAHIEANAINLALDIVWRFADMPEAFYRDWWQVAVEEALHFQLLEAHLQSLDHAYGDFPAHDGLWDMAQRTRSDVLARLALVPRTLEARGLDVTPAIRNKLVSIGDKRGAAILDIILKDEIGHVATGNRWYSALCAQRSLDPVVTYTQLALTHGAPQLKGPFNLPARRAAGFSDDELAALCGTPQTA
ncbi:ferritin-like domain-containing protein [Rhodoferax sp.]|uniref:ferritin-like domain-containing protein n=1 Tax=Rhodoferax sp. TaxID=50421 RepID=UPI0028423F60|nr:ferritin-like domain-containing protein [Rhodoferax sp.]MDR3370314.1 ferritin-like domain-containing protein [Rhodoferax sp.]